MEAVLVDWKQYAAVGSSQYYPEFLTRIGRVDFPALSAKAENDVEIAKGWKSPDLDVLPAKKPD
jgi:hypothetical protein